MKVLGESIGTGGEGDLLRGLSVTLKLGLLLIGWLLLLHFTGDDHSQSQETAERSPTVYEGVGGSRCLLVVLLKNNHLSCICWLSGAVREQVIPNLDENAA